MKKASQEGKLTTKEIEGILAPAVKEPSNSKANINVYKQFFPKKTTSEQMDEVITGLLRIWQAGEIALQIRGNDANG